MEIESLPDRLDRRFLIDRPVELAQGQVDSSVDVERLPDAGERSIDDYGLYP